MNCQEVMELMQRQLDGDLQAREEKELEAHLLHCQDCAAMLERLQRLSDELTQLPKIVPPYSLVDAILPQLDELDRRAAASITEPTTAFSTPARPIAAGQPSRPHWTRRLGSQFSWKFAGGVVAAGLIIGFFAFNMKHPVLDQADGLLQPQAKSESSSTARNAPAADATTGAAEKKTMMQDADIKATPATSGGMQNKAEPAQSTAPQATSQAKLEKPKALDQSDSPKSTLMATSEPVRLKDLGTAGSTAQTEPSTAPSPSEPAAKRQSEEPKSANTLNAVEPTPTPAAKRKNPPEKSDGKNGIHSLMPQSAPSLKSAADAFEAVIEQQHVVIRDSFSQEIVFTSKQQWQESDEITLVEWSKDDQLTYRVVRGGTSKTFVIDVKAKTETAP